VAQLAKNEFIGEIGILCDVPRTATVRAATELTTLKITKEVFFRMVTDFPAMGVEVMRVLAHRLEDTTVKLREARSRIA
jgi:CRP-like cAMP-binding protein